MIMSQCVVPSCNVMHQRQEEVEEGDQIQGGGERISRSSHHVNNIITAQQQQQHNTSQLFPMSKYEVAELTWENGKLAMHGLGGLLPVTPTKPIWGRSNDTLESIVHQATCHDNKDISLNSLQHNQKSPEKMTSGVATSRGKWSESSGRVSMVPGMLKKRTRPESNQCGRNFVDSLQERADRSACASASATFCRDNDTTMMTWASYESPRSLKTKITTDEDSACHGGSENQDEGHETKMETGRSRPSRRSRAASVHNQSERRRRDRINQKMKALQRLVPNANKTDKASMLDEVIDYLKQLQAQVQMMSARNMPQMNMMIPVGMQQHLQMALLARMGMGVGLGMGMGMLDINTMATAARSAPQSLHPLIHPTAQVSATTPAFVPSPFMVPPIIVPCPPAAQANSEPGDANASVPLPDPYCAFLAQSMNMELYNKMAALYRQQENQTTQQATSCPSTQSDHMQGDY